MHNIFSFEKQEIKNEKPYLLPVERLREVCKGNMVLEHALEKVIETFGAYSDKIQEKLYPRSLNDVVTQEVLEHAMDAVEKENPKLYNDISDTVASLVKWLGRVGRNESEILRNLQDAYAYENCALETTRALKEKKKESEEEYNVSA